MGCFPWRMLRFIPNEPDADNADEGIEMRHYIPVLTIAGSDCSGGAGIQADIKTISATGCYAESVITSITAQNTTGVKSITGITPQMVLDQLEMVFADIPPLSVKTGMLFSEAITETVAYFLSRHTSIPLVVDPVMISTSGSRLLSENAVETMIKKLFPISTIVTPNKMEAEALTGQIDIEKQMEALRALGCRNILLKGGDNQETDIKTDYLSIDGDPTIITLRADAVNTNNTHGTGCTLSSAIASYLAMGMDLETAVCRAKLFITKALNSGSKIKCGEGHGPVNHLFSPRKMKYFNHEHYHKS